MSTEKPKNQVLRLQDGDTYLDPGDAMKEFLNWFPDPMRKAEVASLWTVAARDSPYRDAMLEAFWAGIYFAKQHPEKVVLEDDKEDETPPPSTNYIN